jgi:hypothetical protein
VHDVLIGWRRLLQDEPRRMTADDPVSTHSP